MISEKNRLAAKITKYLIGNDTGVYQDNLVIYFEQKIAEKLVRQLNETLNPINNFHYFVNYYWPLVSNIENDSLEDKLDYLDSFYRVQGTGSARILNIKRTINGIREYQICNLRGTQNSDPESIVELSNAILNRIYNGSNNQQLKFVFNSYKYNWKEILKDSFKKRFTDISDAELEQKYRIECESYFYELSTPKSSLAAGNLHQVSLADAEYQALKNSIGIK